MKKNKRGEMRGRCREQREMQRAREQRERGWLNVGLGLEKFLFILAFFLNGGLVELVWFDSVQSVSNFGNRNRTESELFYDFLIG
jgi:hypothetical protein